MIISLYENTFSKEYVNVQAPELMQAILMGKWQQDVEYLRSLDEKIYKTEKTKLYACTWSGTFTERIDKGLELYSGLVCLDIDNLNPSSIDHMKSSLSQDEYVKYAFTSPSGKGIKIVVQVNTGPDDHLSAFLHLQRTFEEKYCFKVDDSGKNISRLCYVSWDDRAIIKESQIFQVDTKYGKVGTYVMPAGLANGTAVNDNKRIFDLCLKWVNRTKQYVSGQRNVYVHAVACALNRCGMNMSDAEFLLCNEFNDLEQKEVMMCCKSAYFRNAGEHGSVEVKDIGGLEDFIAPPYIANYTDDVVKNDLMRITGMLFHHNVPKQEIQDLVVKIAKYYKSEGMIDFDRATLKDLMNEAVRVLNQNIASASEKNALEYETAEDMGMSLLMSAAGADAIKTGIRSIDEAIMGGMVPGTFLGIIGFGGTFKSILSMYIAYINAMNGVPSLYFNGEMSKLQYYERLALMTLNIIWRKAVETGEIHSGNISEIIARMMEKVKRNLIVYNGSSFNEANIISTIEKVEAKEGKKIRLVLIDGITQMDAKGREEIPAAIMNSGICKEVAKKTNTVVLGLLHVSGPVDKTHRDTGEKVRGGQKIIANMDGYFSTSLLIDREKTEALENDSDIAFLEGKMYLRYTDKRSGFGVTSVIVDVQDNLHLREEICDPNSYEVKINKRR
jgi:KaiC/GvpD/RAD55 family RecA-like ATPase